VFRVQLVKSDWIWTETIYIKDDGSVHPLTAPISTADNRTYTLTDDIAVTVSRKISLMKIERDNIILDGQDYSLEGNHGHMGGTGWDSLGLEVYAENITIRNFRISKFFVGINLHNSSNNIISGNQMTANHYGVGGISASNTTISENIFEKNCVYGISLWNSSNINMLENNLTANGVAGIAVEVWSDNNNVSGNIFFNDGLLINSMPNNVVVDNWVNGKPLVYLYGVSNHTVDDAGQIILKKCNNIKVENLNLSKTNIGIELHRTNNSYISGNYLTSNHAYGVEIYGSYNNRIERNYIEFNSWDGIWLGGSINNSVMENTITNNHVGLTMWHTSSNNNVSKNNIMNNSIGIDIFGRLFASECAGVHNNNISTNIIANSLFGVRIDAAANNSIFQNSFINNYEQVHIVTSFSSSYANFWDDNTGKGNYWSDYLDKYPNASEIDDTKVWDIPYTIDENNTDIYPLVYPYTLLFGDTNYDFIVDMRDIAKAAWAFGSSPAHPRWNVEADVNQDGRVDIKDLISLARHFGETWPQPPFFS
jgi:parallel beta-helix repeat protein